MSELDTVTPADWPECGPTGSSPVKGNVSVQNSVTRVVCPPPFKPAQSGSYFDEDDRLVEWALTDEEFTKAMHDYELAQAEYARTGGVKTVINGPPKVEGSFTFKDGSKARGYRHDDEWVWMDVLT